MYRIRNKRLWPKYLPAALQVLRTRRNRATGLTPAKALLGYELPRRGEWQVPTYRKERLAETRTPAQRRAYVRRQQEMFNTKNYPEDKTPPHHFRVGDRVMVRELRCNQPEFSPKWVGPCVITKRISGEVFEVNRDGNITTLHIDKLRPAPRGNPDPENLTDSTSNSEGPPSSSSESLSDPGMTEDEEGPELEEIPVEAVLSEGHSSENEIAEAQATNTESGSQTDDVLPSQTLRESTVGSRRERGTEDQERRTSGASEREAIVQPSTSKEPTQAEREARRTTSTIWRKGRRSRMVITD